MHTHRVMDRTGDTRHDFSPDDKAGIAQAEARFKELTGKGFLAYAPDGNGGGAQLKKFDPTVKETVFRPQLIGG